MYEHLTYLPQDYERTDYNFPLIVYLHDTDYSGYSFSVLKKAPLPSLLENNEIIIPAVIIAPQLDPAETWKVAKIKATVAKVCLEYRIDTHRIYFVGDGIGGYGALKFATIHPQEVAAVVSVAGGGNASMAFYLLDIPIWFFHGTNDSTIPYYKTKALYDALDKSIVRLTELPERTHDIATDVYSDLEIYEWLLNHSK